MTVFYAMDWFDWCLVAYLLGMAAILNPQFREWFERPAVRDRVDKT